MPEIALYHTIAVVAYTCIQAALFIIICQNKLMAGKRIISSIDNYSPAGRISQVDGFTFTNIINPPEHVSLGADFVFDGLAVFICLDGSCTADVNYKRYTLRKNQVLITMPYRMISVREHSSDCLVTGFFLGVDYYTRNNISGPDYSVIRQVQKHPQVTFTDEQMRRLMNLHSVILERYDNMDTYSEECMKALIFSFMAEIKCIYEKNAPEISEAVLTRQEKITDDFFGLLVRDFKEQRSVSYYADRLFLTPKYLSAVIKKVTGHTINEWINEMIINHTKVLLKTTDKTALEISEELNFSSPSFFGRFFRQYTGMTPMQFRHR